MTRRPLSLARLGGLLASQRGLTAAQVSERRRRYGLNAIVDTPTSGWLDLAQDTLRDPIIWFLAGVSVLYGAVGEVTEAIVLAAVILPLAGMDAFIVAHRRRRRA